MYDVCVCSVRLVRLFCDPMDCSPAGSYTHGTLQANILEWTAIPLVQDPPPGDLPNPEIEPMTLASLTLAEFFPIEPLGKPFMIGYVTTIEATNEILH